MSPTKRAAVYCRISRDRTGSMAGVERQEHDCRALVESRGWRLVDVFTDNDVSAYSGKPRPQFARMLDAVKAGTVDVVVAWHPDRLVRHPRELEDLIDVLDAARCPVETVSAGAVDLTTRSGRTTARLVGAVARDESEAKAERLRAMHADKARRGEWKGGTRPFGYRPEGGRLVVDKREADLVRNAARRLLAGETLHGICADWNARSIPTVKAAAWRTPTLRRILMSHTVAGRREYRGEDVGKAAWPAILDARTSRRVRAALDRPDRARGRVARVSLLAGMVNCGACGAALHTQRRTTGARVYVCPARSLGGCGGVSIVADQLDAVVAEAVVVTVESGDLGAVVADSAQREDAGDELAEVEQALVDLAADLGAGTIGRAEWLAARSPLEARRNALSASVAGANGSSAAAPYLGRPARLEADWPTLTLDQQRAIVGAMVDRVVVAKASRRGPGFDPERVAVEWRG